jgi:hypothetical protein
MRKVNIFPIPAICSVAKRPVWPRKASICSKGEMKWSAAFEKKYRKPPRIARYLRKITVDHGHDRRVEGKQFRATA